MFHLFIFIIYLLFLYVFLNQIKCQATLIYQTDVKKKFCKEKIIIFTVYYCTECIKVPFIILAHKTICRLNY